eukprot:254123-Amphidinium_carterae.1
MGVEVGFKYNHACRSCEITGTWSNSERIVAKAIPGWFWCADPSDIAGGPRHCLEEYPGHH